MKCLKACVSVCAGLVITGSQAAAQDAFVTIDGLFSDWQTIDPLYSDPQGDGNGMVDFGRVWMTNDDRFVYVAFEVGGIVSLQSNSEILLGLDTDNNASTGVSVCGIGAELVWEFSERIGSFTVGGQSLNVASQDMMLVAAPSVTSPIFELSLALDAEPRRLGPLFPSDTVRLCLAHGDAGDRLPDEGQQVTFTIDRSAEPRSFSIEIDRKASSALRLLAWNVEQDGLFEGNPGNAIGRILKLLDPDVIVFSEIFDHSAAQTRDRVNELAPPASGEEWFAAAAPASVVVVSKTPIIETLEVDRNGRAHGFLLKGPAGLTDVFVVGAHLFCCEADDRRQSQVDQIMASIRDARNDGSIPLDTPILFAGDMNFVGDYRQPRTLIEGVIVNSSFGPSFDPDWDGTPMTDVVPRTTGLPHTFTWLNPGAPNDRQFMPGRLDYVIFSDAVLTEELAFALYTPVIPFADLQRLGLLASDTGVASDHLPIVVDFAPKSPTVAESRDAVLAYQSAIRVFPTPTSDRIHIARPVQGHGDALIEVYDALGRLVSSERFTGPEGPASQSIDVGALSAGFYVVVVRTNDALLKKGFFKVGETI
ncbi:MAG TPA: endonuclease/exonuclease/phosphatase family protein [Rhodothermales bacterium]|nr:endonuclease/exonuclease/phosphatase family protein [Rhodothermales bacterium]